MTISVQRALAVASLAALAAGGLASCRPGTGVPTTTRSTTIPTGPGPTTTTTGPGPDPTVPNPGPDPVRGRQVERLDRGVASVRSGSGNLVSWRLFGTEPADLGFNVYRDGTK